MRSRDIITVVLSCVVFRALAEIWTNSYGRFDPYYISLACQAGMYAFIALACAFLVKKNENNLKEIVGSAPRSPRIIALAFFIWPILLFGYSLGENAIEALALSKINSSFAYSFFNFHADKKIPYQFLSCRVLSFVAVTAFFGPAVEEFVFRGLLLRGLSKKFGLLKGAVWSSIAFTLLHFSHHDYLGVFIFSIVLSVIYARYGSLLLNIMTHVTFNFLAFIQQYYFDIQWTRSADHIQNVSDWIPQIIMGSLALPLLLALAYFDWRQRDQSLQKF